MTYQALHDLLNLKTTPTELHAAVENSYAAHSTSNVTSLLQFTIPDGKLFYPEPFIASPSYLHSDITYLHIFQYWYWLWFLFIFLICFFFISFVCTVRWCSTRVRPRRETRGVSRSKCGDLITACVPVSWAISIIVNESADATDLNDGFGTAELVVGVRAYQWGWEYYYPKTIDLNYNVKPSYSSFVGNSLQYNFSSNNTLSTNTLWRMYQNKLEDRVVTPAHLLLVPSDASGMVNFMNFKNIGLNTLQASTAFSKIRNSTKVYNSHLVHTPSTFTNKYHSINNTFSSEDDFLTTSSFGIKKQHNLASTSSLGNSFSSTMLDSASFNQFLDANLNINSNSLNEQELGSVKASALSLRKSDAGDLTSTDNSRLTSIIKPVSSELSSNSKLLSYPKLVSNLNDNSDKAGLNYPETRLASTNAVPASYRNNNLMYNTTSSSSSSVTSSPENLTRSNQSSNSKAFNLSGPNSKVLLNDQSIRSHVDLNPSKSNYNLSSKVNTISSNANFSTRSGKSTNPFTTSSHALTNYVDYQLFNKISSSRSFISESHSPVTSSNPALSNSLGYDSNKIITRSIEYDQEGKLIDRFTSKQSKVGDVFVGSREKTPKAINTAYWSTFWSTTDPSHRVSMSLTSNFDRSKFYLPVFYNYSDYDFRNDQAIDMLEELFWETGYSAYNFYDYMMLNKDSNSGSSVTPKDLSLEKEFQLDNLDNDFSVLPLSGKVVKDVSLIGSYYSNSIQMEDYLSNPNLLPTQKFALMPLYSELSEIDESFNSFKGLNALVSKFSNPLLSFSSPGLSTRSYISVFNNFRSDFEDFNWSRFSSYSGSELDDISSWNDGAEPGSDLRLSNLATLRPSIRNSIVNYNAFQKVFRPRLDEGRAHAQSSSFADLGLRQPFLSDRKVPYLQLLGKNRDSFYETPLYFTKSQINFNTSSTLMDSLNTPMYDFPFLLSRTSDLVRFTWIDWFAKWKHIEIQPSSISRYSTIGVPYMRKPYDFNANVGDKFQETESYFIRVARSRRNYLTNWSYTPFMYTRSYVWNAESNFDAALLHNFQSLSSSKFSCDFMTWYWKSPNQLTNSSSVVNYSSSGLNEYNKSTWRPRSGIASYYYNVSTLVDILSKRELLYRRYLENSVKVVHLPSSLCSTPNNPILRELKSSFLFSDPANFSSEYSRDTLYSSTDYFKFTYLKALARTLAESGESLPLNSSIFTNYLFFYFFGSNNSEVNKNLELYKSQYRPLKKGISNMLRLHATGAVAMPIEIRLQVLASSRDVIHSWAIPSASVKIDCVPGYTSHRMMKFLLTGVYWGQCQEICGRYHHWMPIVVYFMKRDLFFLWCTHFVFGPSPNEIWDTSDRRFSDLIRFASYDRSTWLTEFGSTN